MNIFETKVLGGMLRGFIKPSEADLTPADFETDIGDCLRIALQLESEGIVVDPHILHLRLTMAAAESFHSPTDFELMAASVQSVSVVWEAVETVKTAALKSVILTETAGIALQTDENGTQLLERLKKLIARADDHYRTSENNFIFLSELAPKMKAVYSDLYAGVSYSVPTFYDEIDRRMLDGFSRGDEHIVVGFTGSGKSALALAFARRQAKNGLCVGVLSREMSDIENVMRLQSSDANIPRWHIHKGMDQHDFDALNRHMDGEFSKLPIAFDTRTTDVQSLKTSVKRMVETHDMKILYVDYLQLLSNSSNQSSRANEVQGISRTLKEIAMENKIPVVSLCQFNRGAGQASIFDILSHLKESSGIEQDASTIMYIQLEKTEEKKKEKEAKLTILKNRNGAAFEQSIELLYRGETFTFTEYEKQESLDLSGVYRGG